MKFTVFIYLLIVNICAVFIYCADKRKAVKHKWRTPESVLIGIAIIGGSVGSLIGMYAFRHKTRHPKFFIGVPIILIIQAAVLFLFLRGLL